MIRGLVRASAQFDRGDDQLVAFGAGFTRFTPAGGLTRAGGGEGGGATGGSSLWLATPPGVDASHLERVLKTRDVLIEPGARFFADPAEGRGFFRLAYSSISAERIPEGIRRIAQAMSEVQD